MNNVQSGQLNNEPLVKGVMYTRDVMCNRPYYMIQYTDETGHNRSKLIAKNISREFLTERCYELVRIAKEIEEAFPETDAFAISFRIDKGDKVTVLGNRPLEEINNMARHMTDKEFNDTKSFAKCTYLDTNHILSDSAYWNPLGKLGTNPRPLDYSLFREILSENIWNESIVPLGYTVVNGELLQKVGNKPYVSLDNTMECLTPPKLSSTIRYKLFDFYETCLVREPALHNSFVGKVMHTSYDFTISEKLRELSQYGFRQEEIDKIHSALHDLTVSMLKNYDEITHRDKEQLQKLIEIRRQVRQAMTEAKSNIMKMNKLLGELLHAIKEYGSPQYVRQCRWDFMARKMCASLAESGYFKEKDIENFIKAIPTKATELKRDLYRYMNCDMTREEFISLYGHLRSSAFDIRTDNYKNIRLEQRPVEARRKYYSDETIIYAGKLLDVDIIKKALSEHNIPLTPEKFIDTLMHAIKNKEIFRVEWTKSLSLMLDIIIDMGNAMGIEREDLSYLEVQDLLSFHSRDTYIYTIQSRRDMYYYNTYLLLPDIIFNMGDIDVVKYNKQINTDINR